MRNLLYVVFALFMTVPLMAQTEDVKTATTGAEDAKEEVAAAETTPTKRTAAAAYNDAVAKMRQKEYAAAMPLFEEAIRLANANPTDSTNIKTLRLANKNGSKAAYGYSAALRKEQKYDEMLKMATRGIEMDDDYYANHINQAKALDKLGKTDEAVEAYFLAAEYSKQAERPADKVASLYRSGFLKLYKAKDFDAIIEAAKNNEGALEVPDINYYLAKAYESKGNTEKAIVHAAKAGELGSAKKSGKYFSYLGDLYRKATQVQKSIEAYKQVPQGNRYYAQAQYNITKLSNKK